LRKRSSAEASASGKRAAARKSSTFQVSTWRRHRQASSIVTAATAPTRCQLYILRKFTLD
jgi:hypothetical protein